MKLIIPKGISLDQKSDLVITPFSCVCSGDANYYRYNFSGCQNCVCECSYGSENQAANHLAAFNWNGI